VCAGWIQHTVNFTGIMMSDVPLRMLLFPGSLADSGSMEPQKAHAARAKTEDIPGMIPRSTALKHPGNE
jgi:hypothetical protein